MAVGPERARCGTPPSTRPRRPRGPRSTTQEQRARSRPEQPDPDRRRGALPVQDQALARHQGRLRADLRPSSTPPSRCSSSSGRWSRSTGASRATRSRLPDRRGHARRRLAARAVRAHRARHEGLLDDPQGRSDGLGRHLDAELEAPRTRTARCLAEVRGSGQGAGEAAKFNTYTPANSASCAILGKLCTPLHADGDATYLNRNQVLEDADQRLRQRQERLRGLHRVVTGVDRDQGLSDGR